MFDRTQPFPQEYKSIKKEIDADIKASELYGDLLFSAARSVYEFESGIIDGKQGGRQMVKNIDTQIKKLVNAKVNMKKAEANTAKALKKIKNSRLVDEYRMVNVSNEQKMIDQMDIIHSNVLEYLFNVKNFYGNVANTGTNFAVINGLSLSGDYKLSLDYFEYLEKSRLINKTIIANVEHFMKLYAENEEFLRTYLPNGELSKMEQAHESLKEVSKQMDQKVATANDLSSKSLILELNNRLEKDSKLLQLAEQMANLANEVGPLIPTTTDSITYSDKFKMNELANKYSQYNKLDKEYAVREFQIKKGFFKEFPRSFNDHKIYDFLSDGEAANTQKEIRDLLYITVTVDLNSKLYDKLNKNFGKFRLAFDDQTVPYNFVFPNFKVNSEYIKDNDWYTKIFSEQMKQNTNQN